MALARVFDDLPDLLARIAAIGIDHVVAFELDAGFGIEVVLVGLEAGHQVNLPLGLRHPDQFALAEVYHDPAIGQRRPILTSATGSTASAPEPSTICSKVWTP